MENTKALTVKVTCESNEVQARYEVLAKKMIDDSEFKAKLNQCKTEESIYGLYKDFGYTDLSFEDFKVQFKDQIASIVTVLPKETFELTEDELDNVVGGNFFFDAFIGIVNLIPVAGPIIAGVAKAVKAGIEGQGIDKIVANVGVGLLIGAFDAIVTISTLGTGNALTTGAKIALGAAAVGREIGSAAADNFIL